MQMQPIIKTFFFLILVWVVSLTANAQTCSGSLGDPVINETFGAGATYGMGPPLPATVTNYNYAGSQCPDDGSYTIASGLASCFGNTWQVVPSDHTGDRNGYMMIINASYSPGIFYTQRAQGYKLCPNTTYEFAAWILNLIVAEEQTTGFIEPNITFSIETTSGTVLKTYNTDNIPAVKATDKLPWKQYGTFFTTPSDGSDIVVKMINNAPGGSGNDLILDDITFRPCGPIIQSGFGSIDEAADKNLCAGDDAVYTLKASQTGYSDPRFQWQANYNDTGWQDISGETTTTLVIDKTFKNATAGIYRYRVGILNGNVTSLSCRIYSPQLTITVNPLPVIHIAAITPACEGLPLTLTATGGDDYQWSGPNNFVSDKQSPLLSASADKSLSGTYTVKVTTKNCPSFASTTVNVSPRVVTNISNDVSICQGGSAPLLAQSQQGIYYKWSPSTGLDHDDIPNPVASPTVTTRYTVKVSSDDCYDDSKSVTVTVLDNPVAHAGKAKKLFEGQSVTLDGTLSGDHIIDYFWTPTDHLDNPHSLTPVASPVDDITYTLHVISESCGESSSDVFVKVYKKLGLPNAFTPNADGINDYWNIKNLTTYPDCSVAVYSKYGSEVYKSAGYAKPWDGTNRGSPVPSGTYYYIIDLHIGTPKIAGWVLVLR